MASYSGQIGTVLPATFVNLTSSGHTALNTIAVGGGAQFSAAAEFNDSVQFQGAASFAQGASMTGDRITSVGAPVSAGDAATKSYVDAAIATAEATLTLGTETIALTGATTTPVDLSGAAALHLGSGGTSGVTSTTVLGTVAAQPVGSVQYMNASLVAAGAVWQIDFGAGNIVDATGTARQFLNLTAGQSVGVAKVSASAAPQWGLLESGGSLS